MDCQKKGNIMEKRMNYFVIVLLTIVLAAATAFAFVDGVSVPPSDAEAQSSKNTISHSFTDGSVSHDGKTGWQIVADQVANLK